jgi:hypothetical protein
MKKISIISPVFDNVNRLGQTINGLVEFFNDKYDFEVLYYHSVDLPAELTSDSHFMFYKIKKGQSFDDCVTDGFSKTNGNCVIVADLNSLNYKDYLLKMIVEWENNAQVVLIKKEKEEMNFFQKIGKFFGSIFGKLYDLLLGLVGLNKDFRAMRTFQLFSENVAEVIKEFPEKNYYLRNFDCWVDYRVTVLYSKDFEKVKRHQKVANINFFLYITSFLLFFGLLFTTIFTTNLIDVSSRSMYVLIGVGLMAVFFVFGLYNLFKWFIFKKTHLTSSFKK